METKSPASTSGAFLLTDATVSETKVLVIPSNVGLLGYTSEEADPKFEKVELIWEENASRLTHPSATNGYAVFKTDCMSMGIPPVSFQIWLSSATRRVADLVKENHHLQQGASAHL